MYMVRMRLVASLLELYKVLNGIECYQVNINYGLTITYSFS